MGRGDEEVKGCVLVERVGLEMPKVNTEFLEQVESRS
jgi:hypothetical protein